MMNSEDKVKKEAQKLMEGGRGCHDWSHTERVYNLCMHIGRNLNANLEVLGLAAILHDIGRDEQDRANGTLCHAELGAKIAQEILKRNNYSEGIIEQVCHCIITHRYRNSNVPETVEAKVLFDADKLDCIGAVGVGRAFLFAGEVGATLHIKDIDLDSTKPYSREDTGFREFKAKLQYVKDRMMTEEGKKLAQERHKFMVNFFKRLDEEVDGLR
jgi:uncharacterized protein